MTNKQPPFEINERIMADVIEIAELVGRVSVTDKISMNPTLRRTNRISVGQHQKPTNILTDFEQCLTQVSHSKDATP